MSRSNKIVGIIVIFLILLSIIFTIIYTKNRKSENIENIFLSEILVFKDGTEYEVLVDKKTKETILRIDDAREVYYKFPREGKSRVQIPNFAEIESENTLAKVKSLINYTYPISFFDGCKYVKLLIEDGLEIAMYIATPSYYEVFLKGDETYKRVVLFSDSLMVGDMLIDAELPEVYDYLNSYDFNGYILEKLNNEQMVINEEE